MKLGKILAHILARSCKIMQVVFARATPLNALANIWGGEGQKENEKKYNKKGVDQYQIYLSKLSKANVYFISLMTQFEP